MVLGALVASLFAFFVFGFGAEQQYRCGYCNGRVCTYDNAETNCEGKAPQALPAEDIHYQHNYKRCERR